MDCTTAKFLVILLISATKVKFCINLTNNNYNKLESFVYPDFLQLNLLIDYLLVNHKLQFTRTILQQALQHGLFI